MILAVPQSHPGQSATKNYDLLTYLATLRNVRTFGAKSRLNFLESFKRFSFVCCSIFGDSSDFGCSVSSKELESKILLTFSSTFLQNQTITKKNTLLIGTYSGMCHSCLTPLRPKPLFPNRIIRSPSASSFSKPSSNCCWTSLAFFSDKTAFNVSKLKEAHKPP